MLSFLERRERQGVMTSIGRADMDRIDRLITLAKSVVDGNIDAASNLMGRFSFTPDHSGDLNAFRAA